MRPKHHLVGRNEKTPAFAQILFKPNRQMFSCIASLSVSSEFTNPPFKCMLKLTEGLKRKNKQQLLLLSPKPVNTNMRGLYINRDVWAVHHLCTRLIAKYPLIAASMATTGFLAIYTFCGLHLLPLWEGGKVTILSCPTAYGKSIWQKG